MINQIPSGPSPAYIATPVNQRVSELDTNVSPYPFFWVQFPDGEWIRWFIYPAIELPAGAIGNIPPPVMPLIPPDPAPKVMPLIP